jgi:beta-1,4-N-acetylglucosaminyltransferase
MIFVTVGSSDCDFSRLTRKIDRLVIAGSILDVVVQTGNSFYKPKACKAINFVPQVEIEELVKKSDFILCHGGTGTIDMALGFRKKTIVVPRLARYGEITDNHQLELAELLEKSGRVLVAYNIDDIDRCLEYLPTWKPIFRKDSPSTGFKQYLGSHIRKLL